VYFSCVSVAKQLSPDSPEFAKGSGNPRVSVIIPTYNRVGVLYYALNSVLNQTMQDFEVFVVDDASTDKTPEYVASITDPRVHYIRLPTNRFAAAARNAGMERARGGYIAFLDSDDQWWPTKLEKQVALLDSLSDEWGCSYGGAYVNKTGGLTRQPAAINWELERRYWSAIFSATLWSL